jgi:hypothetical protein
MVGVYEGTEVDSLVKVVRSYSDQGPKSTGREREWTFRAVAGKSYEIAVDGNAFYVPPEAPPATEGEFTLRIEATPPPANDNFENAQALEGETFGEGVSRFYRAEARGYNWGASKQAGEPDDDGDPGGSSVWYS